MGKVRITLVKEGEKPRVLFNAKDEKAHFHQELNGLPGVTRTERRLKPSVTRLPGFLVDRLIQSRFRDRISKVENVQSFPAVQVNTSIFQGDVVEWIGSEGRGRVEFNQIEGSGSLVTQKSDGLATEERPVRGGVDLEVPMAKGTRMKIRMR